MCCAQVIFAPRSTAQRAGADGRSLDTIGIRPGHDGREMALPRRGLRAAARDEHMITSLLLSSRRQYARSWQPAGTLATTRRQVRQRAPAQPRQGRLRQQSARRDVQHGVKFRSARAVQPPEPLRPPSNSVVRRCLWPVRRRPPLPRGRTGDQTTCVANWSSPRFLSQTVCELSGTVASCRSSGRCVYLCCLPAVL